MPESNSNKDYIRILGTKLLISRKIELVALAALCLALATLFFQVKGCMEGPEVSLLAPDQIFIIRDDSFTDKKVRVRFGANMVYVNSGQKGYNGIVTQEFIRFDMGGKSYEHSWDQFAEFAGGVKDLHVKNGKTASPFTVYAGEAKTHQTYFTPWPHKSSDKKSGQTDVLKNHAYWDDFIKDLKRRVEKGEKEYTFTFEAKVLKECTSKTTCKISIDKQIIGAIEKYNGYCPTCYAD